jgi:hypothetical protein
MKQTQLNIWSLRALAIAVTGGLAIGCGDSGSPSSAIDCDASEAQSFLAGTCAEGLGDLLACWMPVGECRAEVDISGDFDIVFDNGARLVQTVDGPTLSIDGEYVSPTGTNCGSFMSAGDFTTNNGRLDFLVAGGEMFSFVQNGVAYDIVCPGGETLPLSDVQQQVIEGCTGSAETASTCTQPDVVDIDPGDIGDLTCAVNSDCPRVGGFQLECCGPSLGGGLRTCLTADACAFL